MIVEQNWQQTGSTYTDNFLPFVLDVMHEEGGCPSASEISALVQESWGVHVPGSAVEQVLGRAGRRKLVKRRQHRYELTKDGIESAKARDLRRTSADVQRQIRALVDRLVEFTRSRHAIEVGDEEAERYLRSFVEESPTAVLRALNADVDDLEVRTEARDYVVGSFIVHTLERDAEGAAYLESMAKGAALSYALYLQGDDTDRRFQRTKAFLDTPVLLSLLGLHGPEARQLVTEFIALAREAGLGLACFADTVAETRGVVDAAARDLKAAGRRRRQLGAHARAESWSSADLERLSSRLPDRLESFGIEQHERPEIRFDTKKRGDLEAELGRKVNYRPASDTRDHDRRCVEAVFQLRGGKPKNRLEESRAIFVTTNGGVISAAHHALTPRASSEEPPVAIGLHELSTRLWLKKPAVAPDLPWSRMVADCYAAMEPGPRLWEHYLEEVERLQASGEIGDSDYAIARFASEARMALMERTGGGTVRPTVEIARDVVRDARERVTAEEREKAEQAQQEAAQAESQLQEAQTELEDKVRRLGEYKQELEEHRAQRAAMCRAAVERAERRANRVVGIMRSVVVAAALGGALVGSAHRFGITDVSSWPSVAAWMAVVAASLVVPPSMMGLLAPKRVGNRITEWFVQREASELGLSVEELREEAAQAASDVQASTEME